MIKEKSDDKEIIEQLISAVKNLNKDNKDLKNEMNNIKKDLDNLKAILFQHILPGSSIIKNFEEVINIKKWINEKNEKNINKEIKLIYKATRDGDSKYHEFYDNKNPLITLIKTKKNRRFGHYMEQKVITSNSSYTKDEKAILFNLDNLKKYDIKKPEYAMYYLTSHGPCFGQGCDLVLTDKFLTRNDNWESNAKYNTYDVENNTEFTGESSFRVEEVEVYQILA